MSATPQKKRCLKCGEIKSASEFTPERRAPDGLRARCRACYRVEAQEYRARIRDQNYTRGTEIPDTKKCSACQCIKPSSEFNKNATNPDGLQQHCRECRLVYAAMNRDQRQEYARNYYALNADTIREKVKKYEQINAEKVRIRQRKAYLRRKVRPEWQERQREYYQKKREALDPIEWRIHQKIERKRRYTSNPAKHIAYVHKYRALLDNAEGCYSSDEWQAMCDWFGNCCLACGVDTTLTVDHVVPLSKGGTNWIWNLQPLCRPCNSAKNNRHQTDYRNPEDLAAFLAWLKQ